MLSLAVLAALLLSVGTISPAAAQGAISVSSSPEAAALYLGDLAYLHDTLTLPAGEPVYVALPATALTQSLVVTEGGARVRTYRLVRGGDGATSVTWDAPDGGAAREVALDYLATGAGWQPVYDMTVLADDRVQFGFDAEIRSTALHLDGVDLRLVAGMPGADSGYQPQMTAAQANVGYFEQAGAAPALGGPVQVQHVYAVGTQRLVPGDVLRVNLVSTPLDARRLLVWDARFGQRVDVIYKVMNDSDVPFVEGPVNAYQDGLYVGQDAIEWTPTGSEGSVTIAGLSDVRTRRTESVEVVGGFAQNEDYRHDVTLSLSNHSAEDLAITVLDEWNAYGFDFTFSHEPQRQGNNVLRWEMTLPAGDTVEITYTFTTD